MEECPHYNFKEACWVEYTDITVFVKKKVCHSAFKKKICKNLESKINEIKLKK